ncbi:MAG: response regulator [Candidatus Hydrogenedentes bacterium]|nr:response regulator [Candidatus Hydrogenedentota bacterium]
MAKAEKPAEGTAEGHYARALREMAIRYEGLVKGFSILREMDRIDDPRESFERICVQMLEVVAAGLSAENSSLMMAAEGGAFELRAASSPLEDEGRYYGPGAWKGRRFTAGEGVIGRAAATAQAQRVADVTADPDFVVVEGSPVTVRSLLCYPLLSGSRVLGVLNLSHSRSGFFSVESENILSLVADRCGRLLAGHLAHDRNRRSQEHYRLVSENAEEGILVFDDADRVVSANPAAARVVGMPVERLLAGEVSWEDGVVAEDRAAFRAHRARVRQRGVRDVIEYRYRDMDGAIHHVEEQSSQTSDLTGRAGAIVSILRDASERKRAESEKVALEEQLRHAQKMEAVGELAGGVAHDFNNLLTGIIGNVSLARSIHDGKSIHSLLAEAERAAKRAAAVVKQLMVFSRRSPVERKPADVRAIIEEVAGIARNTFDRRVQIQVETADDLRPALVDAGQIHQVLLNLCVNARDAVLERGPDSGPGGLRITLGASNVFVTEEDRRANPEARPGWHVCVSVSDTGAGMDEETRRRAFEPFYTTKGPERGTGLGLAIVYGIMKQHNGWIVLDTNPGRGTAFLLYLDAAEEVAMEEPGPAAPAGVATGTETVLLVDDEDMVRTLGRKILERLGYTVLLAANGEEGLALYERERGRINLVLLDLTMPGLAGDEVLERIRAMDPDAKVILSSGHAVDAELTFAGTARPTACLGKPYTYGEIAAVLREVLDGDGA